MSSVAKTQNNKLHPHKFFLWLAIGSILMMFAGLTSAYVVKRNQANWVTFQLPMMFWYSTAVILASSVTLYFSAKAFKEKAMSSYRSLMTTTLVLGVLFIALQIIGFIQLWNAGATLQSNVSYSFLYVIVGIHAVHVLGGVITLLVMSLEAFSKKTRYYSSTPVELISTYWHFVDFLWLYLLVFLLMIR
jgi:cytochrome c oxidase subunit 3